MSDPGTDDAGIDDPETTTINIRITERQLEEIDAWPSRTAFLADVALYPTPRGVGDREEVLTASLD